MCFLPLEEVKVKKHGNIRLNYRVTQAVVAEMLSPYRIFGET